MIIRNTKQLRSSYPVTLRTVADYVGLAPCSVSAILNDSAACRSIPQRTRDRVLRAAARLNYQPNYSARSLRTKKTFTVALIANDFGRSSVACMVTGAEEGLRGGGYRLLIATYEREREAFERAFVDLRQRGIEGLIAVQVKPALATEFPMVFINPLCAYAPEPLTPNLREELKAAGRSAADEIVRRIESERSARVPTA